MSVALLLAASWAAAQAPAEPRSAPATDGGWIGMPAEELFDPLLADPKEPLPQASLLWARSRARSRLMSSIGIGETIGLVRWPGPGPAEGVQLGLMGVVFALFDIPGATAEYMNADYLVGIPVSWRRGRWSARARLYHQSSHLGDEYLLARHPERVNLSYEAVQVVGALEHRGGRVYAGGEVLVHTSSPLPIALWHLGADWHDPAAFGLGNRAQGRLVAGIDVQRPWSRQRLADVSVRAGVEFRLSGRAGDGRRRWAVLAEYHGGDSPYGQFYFEGVSYLGVRLMMR